MKSIEINQKRFGYSDDLKAVFDNTFNDIFWCYGCDYQLCREFSSACNKTSPGKEYVKGKSRA
jgi:hypothetical protein